MYYYEKTGSTAYDDSKQFCPFLIARQVEGGNWSFDVRNGVGWHIAAPSPEESSAPCVDANMLDLNFGQQKI